MLGGIEGKEGGTPAADGGTPFSTRMGEGIISAADGETPVSTAMRNHPVASIHSHLPQTSAIANESSDLSGSQSTTHFKHQLYLAGILPSPATKIRISIRRRRERQEMLETLKKRAKLMKEIKKVSKRQTMNSSSQLRSVLQASLEKVQNSTLESANLSEGMNNSLSIGTRRFRDRLAFWQDEDFLPTSIIDSSSGDD